MQFDIKKGRFHLVIVYANVPGQTPQPAGICRTSILKLHIICI